MADYYTQFSILVPVSKEIGQWLIDKINNYEDADGEAFVCDCKWDEQLSGVWLWCDEYFNADYLEDCLQHMLKKFKLDLIISMQWADTCSKPRIDSFGGGWMVISRNETLWGNTHQAAKEAEEALRTGNQRL